MSTPKCKNCGCVITRYKKDEYCPRCTSVLDQPYKLFKRKTHRMLYIGFRDAAIALILAILLGMTRFGLYLKWYVYISAGLLFTGSIIGYAVLTVKTNRRMYQEGYGGIVEADDFPARCIAKLRRTKSGSVEPMN